MEFRILVIDTDQRVCEFVQDALESQGWSVSWCTHGEHGLELAREQPFDAVLIDVALHDINGLQVCRRLTENYPGVPVIVSTEGGDMPSVVAALRAGAYDFVSKPLLLTEFRAVVERGVCDRYRLEAVQRLAQQELTRGRLVGRLQGDSRAITRVCDLIRRVAATQTTVLLSGESVARALHAESHRAHQPFVAINCAAVPAHLLESELFGHVRGSFTDAASDRKGVFQQASDGTLFLDEIGELPLELQPKLLRVLQERQLRPVGGNVSLKVQTRIIAATNRDLEREVAAGRFREDLFYRLNVVQIQLPALRTRGNDILVLAEYFVRSFAEKLGKPPLAISPAVSRKLLAYDWPGNVRQLENTMERAVTLAREAQLSLEDLPDRICNFDPVASQAAVATEDLPTLDQHERRHIERVLRMVKGNKTEAARLLGINRRTLYRKRMRDGVGSG
jgi:DNA-binding NtrC family response regulator